MKFQAKLLDREGFVLRRARKQYPDDVDYIGKSVHSMLKHIQPGQRVEIEVVP